MSAAPLRDPLAAPLPAEGEAEGAGREPAAATHRDGGLGALLEPAGLVRSVEQLAFTPDQRDWLGLDAVESLRVLASGPRTVVLERLGGSEPPALPWDRLLVLSADVRAFPMADVLHMLHAAAKSGFLLFECGDTAKSVYVHRGEVVFATSNQVVDRLGQCLLRLGVLTPEQHRVAARAYSPERLFGRVLVERGYLTPRQLWNGVKLQVEEIVRSLLAYGAGRVHFWEGEVRPDNVVRLALPTAELVAEGLDLRKELRAFQDRLEQSGTQLVPLAGTDLAGTERAVFEALVPGRGFRDVCSRAGVDPLTGARAIQLLRWLGAVEVRLPSVVEEATDAADDAVREVVRAHVKVLNELTVPLVAVEGAAGVRQRLERELAEASRRHPAVLEGVTLGASATLDPEQLIEHALCLVGDRELEVREALGALVSYLEFELLNHPRIEDPEQFLDGIELLRNRL